MSFLTNMSEKRKSATHSAIQVKKKSMKDNQNIHVIRRLEKVTWLLTCAVMLDSFIVKLLQFMIMLIELQSAKSGTEMFV